MKEHDLFTTIGGAEDAFLAELEQPQVRRLPKHFALIAAMLALVLTACAAPVVIRTFDKIQTGSIAENGRGHNYQVSIFTPGEGWSEQTALFVPSDVELEVSVDPDAPDKIESHYIPLKLLDYCQVESHTDTDSEFSLELSMDFPGVDAQVGGIFYRQYALPEDGHIVIPDVFGRELGLGLYAFYESELQQSLQTYGETTVLEFSGDFNYKDADGQPITYADNRIRRFHTKFLFWSDGFYLYCLKIPMAYPLTITKVEEIVTSLTAVDDITEYLPDSK